MSLGVVRDLEQGVSARPRQAAVERLTAALGIAGSQTGVAAGPGAGDRGGAGDHVPGRGLRLQVLGSLRVWRDGVVVSLGGVRRRAVLGLLVLEAGSVVGVGSLCEVLWEGEPPPTAGVMIQSHVSRLRAALEPESPARARGSVLETVGGGYRLRADRLAVDVTESRALARQARAAVRAGDGAVACGLFEQALELWQGEPLAEVGLLRGHPGVAGLAREYAALVVEFAEAASRVGWHDRVLGRLFDLTERDRLDERAHACLMVALAGGGQQAAALAVFDAVRRRLDDELGVRPGAPLTEAHARVLRQQIPPAVTAVLGSEGSTLMAGTPGDLTAPGMAPPGAASPDDDSVPAPRVHSDAGFMPGNPRGVTRAGPFQLPPTVVDFTGRAGEEAQLREWVGGAHGNGVPVVVVSGPPGAGKSALMLHAAHQLRDSFPDGQLWAGLDGASGRPRDPGEVLGEWLRALGSHGFAVPVTVAERAALLRTMLAGRRVLVAVDDAGSAEQVRPLLPGTAGCAVVVTSRRQLPELAGVRLLPLGPLPADEAQQLLGRIAGAGRVTGEARAAADLVAACGHLPLAVRIAGAKLAARPSSPIAALAESVATERRRLDVLRAGSLSVRASIASGYRSLSAAAQRAFRLLALLGPCDVAEWVIGVLLDEPDPAAVVEELTDRSMLTVAGTDGTGQARYRLHDLLRDYAADQLASEPEQERGAALQRAQDGWLQLAAHASDQLPAEPFFPRRRDSGVRATVPGRLAESLTADPLAWFGAERLNLLTAIERACSGGDYRFGSRLAGCQAKLQNSQDRYDDAARMWQVVADAADLAADDAAATVARLRLAAATLEGGYSADVMDLLSDCMAQLARSGDSEHLAFAHYWRSACAYNLDRFEESRRDAEQGVALARRIQDPHAELTNLRILGLALIQSGERAAGVAACEQAVNIADVLGEDLFRLYALHSLSFCYVLVEQYERAVELAPGYRGLAKDLGYVSAEALSLGVLGDAYAGLGRHAEALSAYQQALPVFRDHFIRRNHALVLYKLGRVYQSLGDLEQARRHLAESLSIFREVRLAIHEARAEQALRECRQNGPFQRG